MWIYSGKLISSLLNFQKCWKITTSDSTSKFKIMSLVNYWHSVISVFFLAQVDYSVKLLLQFTLVKTNQCSIFYNFSHCFKFYTFEYLSAAQILYYYSAVWCTPNNYFSFISHSVSSSVSVLFCRRVPVGLCVITNMTSRMFSIGGLVGF